MDHCGSLVALGSIYTVLTTWAQPYLQDSDDTASLLANVGLWLTSFYLLLSKSKVCQW